jgi:hypothetical protein
MNGDKIDVITPQRIAAEEEFRVISVTVVDNKSIDDPTAIIAIDIKPNDSIDSVITATEIATNVDKIHYFNVERAFATYTEIARSEIAAPFRETLWQTFEDATVLESVLSEPLHYLNFTVNNFASFIPIYNGQSLSFSDNQTHCIDGVKASEIFYMDGKTPNIINVQNPDTHKYKFKFDFNHKIYKDIYVITDADLINAGIYRITP